MILAFLFILAQLPPPPPRPTLPTDRPFAGVVASVNRLDPYFGWSGVVVVADGRLDARFYRRAELVVRFRVRPGLDWPAEALIVGDRVEVVWNAWYRHGSRVLTVTTARDPDLPLILACERSVARFARSSGCRVVPPATIPARLRSASAHLGGRRYAVRESATRVLATAGTAGVRALAWAERDRDAEVRHRAAVAIERVLRGDGR